MVAAAWVRTDRVEARRRDRQADRDGDAELAAYNAQLAQLAERHRRSVQSSAEAARREKP
jgi:putative copper resistance protein D